MTFEVTKVLFLIGKKCYWKCMWSKKTEGFTNYQLQDWDSKQESRN